jgi:HK97 family phage major capsid protein
VAVKRTEKFPMMHREASIELTRAATDGEEAVYTMSISSEHPVSRWFGVEVLGHKKSEIDMSRLNDGAPLLLNHDSRTQIGVIERAWVDTEEKKVRAEFRFSRSALGQEIEADVVGKIRRKVSVGYSIERMKLVETGDPDQGKADVYRAIGWTPHEASIVPVPADPTVGVGRGETGERKFNVEIEDGDTVQEEEEAMKKGVGGASGDPLAALDDDRGAGNGDEGGGEGVKPVVVAGDDRAAARVREIVALGRKFGASIEDVDGWVAGGLTPEQVRDTLLEKFTTEGAAVRSAADVMRGVPKKERDRYSYRKALIGAVLLAAGRGSRFGGLEKEMHEELENNLPKDVDRHGGIHIPIALDPATWERVALEQALGVRAYPLDSATATEGKEGVFTAKGEFIELLRNRLTVAGMGARILPGLVGPVKMPRQTAAGTFTWYTEEAAAISDSMLALDTVDLSPKTGMSSSGYTRQLLAQESIGIEMLVREDLAAIHAVGLDAAALVGTGASGQPKGVAYQTGVGTVDFGAGGGANAAPSFAKLVDMQGTVGDANADLGSLGYIFTPLCAASAKKVLEFPTAPGGAAVWQGPFANGVVAGYRAMASNQAGKVWLNGVPTGGTEHGLFFANWRELMIGMWGSMEVIVDPYSLKKRAIIEVTTYQNMDVAIRHGGSFVIGENVIA